MEDGLTPEIPHAQGPEKSVLSSIFKNPAMLEDCPHLSVEHFHLPAHKGLFACIQEVLAKGLELEPVTFIQNLHESGRLDEVGGTAAFSDIYTYAPNNAHFGQHLRALTDKLALRNALKLAYDLKEAIDEGLEPEDIAELVANRSTLLSDGLSESVPSEDTKTMIRRAVDRYKALASGQQQAMGMETSLMEINRRFRGLKAPRITVISALPSHGKTLLGGQLFMDCVLAGHRGMFLTWEMTEDELLDRFIAYAAKLPIDAVVDPLKYAKEITKTEKPTKETLIAIRRGQQLLADADFEIRAMHGKSFTQAFAAIRREHRKRKLGITALDFIQRIRPLRGTEKETFEQQLTKGADAYQNLAKELGFHGLLLSQLNKEGAAKHAEGINESCALHLKIEKTPGFHGIGVVKDRFHGQTGRGLPIILDESTQRFIHDHQSKN